MFSARKKLIKAAEAGALAGSILLIAVSMLVSLGRLDPNLVKLFFLPALLVQVAVFASCFALASEFNRIRGKASEAGRADLSFREMRMLLRWCPLPLRLSYVVALGVAIYTVYAVGFGVSWRSGEPFTEQEALGFSLFGALMLLVELPMLASAARMPGTYAEHFHPRLRGGNDA